MADSNLLRASQFVKGDLEAGKRNKIVESKNKCRRIQKEIWKVKKYKSKQVLRVLRVVWVEFPVSFSEDHINDMKAPISDF
ncbi:unnamed protein product [Sphenostylis stenocarpa]|uniref:Uncharacterized protein n=1 Tax=Sphenostylis stenocarpa TaxID=92480 RepID=A0AA86W500_9FABA|nr:unnamed protein product [Sphenostylis stenocarpa]